VHDVPCSHIFTDADSLSNNAAPSIVGLLVGNTHRPRLYPLMLTPAFNSSCEGVPTLHIGLSFIPCPVSLPPPSPPPLPPPPPPPLSSFWPHSLVFVAGCGEYRIHFESTRIVPVVVCMFGNIDILTAFPATTGMQPPVVLFARLPLRSLFLPMVLVLVLVLTGMPVMVLLWWVRARVGSDHARYWLSSSTPALTPAPAPAPMGLPTVGGSSPPSATMGGASLPHLVVGPVAVSDIREGSSDSLPSTPLVVASIAISVGMVDPKVWQRRGGGRVGLELAVPCVPLKRSKCVVRVRTTERRAIGSRTDGHLVPY
jgi:hypothetical protein